MEADVEVYLNQDYLKTVKDFDLSENFITSKAVAKKLTSEDGLFKLDGVKDIKASVKKAEGEKCPRCWKIFLNQCERCELIN